MQTISMTNYFDFELSREGVCIERRRARNLVTDTGANLMLTGTFSGSLGGYNWYIGLVNSSGFSAFAVTDTPTSHPGWSDAQPGRFSDTKPLWNKGSASGRSITNPVASGSVFNMASTITIKGAFLTDVQSGTTSATLFCEAALSSPISCVSGDVLKITYTVSIS